MNIEAIAAFFCATNGVMAIGIIILTHRAAELVKLAIYASALLEEIARGQRKAAWDDSLKTRPPREK